MAWEDEPGGDLEGAEQDALLMREVLVKRWGLPEENTLTLLSLEATKEAIRESITGWLAERAGPGDLAIFYFAGHGAQVYDLDGDEPDGLDETLAPTDILPLSSANDIRDDDFRQWLGTVDTDIVVILDSCHSGTATRGGNMRARSLDRPLPSEGGREPARVRQKYDSESMADGSSTILELAAAGPNQSAMEGDFRLADGDGIEARGAFTYHLVRELWRAESGTSYEDLMSYLVSSLKAGQFMQDPNLTGSGKGMLFGSSRSKTAPALSLPDAQTGDDPTLTSAPLPPVRLLVDASALPGATRTALRAELAQLPGIDLLEPGLSIAELHVVPSGSGPGTDVLGRDGQIRSVVAHPLGSSEWHRETLQALDRAWVVRGLAALDNPARPFSIGIEVSSKDVGVGAPAAIVTVTSAAPGYLTIVALESDGRFVLLTPEGGRDRIGPDDPVLQALGRDTSGVGSKSGFLLAIVTPSRLDMQAATSADRPRDKLLLLRRALEEVTNRSGSAATWSSRLVVY